MAKEPSWKDYDFLYDHRGYSLFKHKKGESPKYAFRKRYVDFSITVWGVTDNSITDLKILAEEEGLHTFGPGILSGYPFRGEKPKEVYRGVKIGEYVLRSKATHLPKFAAIVRPDGVRSSDENETVEARTLPQIRKKIDTVIASYNSERQKLFPNT